MSPGLLSKSPLPLKNGRWTGTVYRGTRRPFSFCDWWDSSFLDEIRFGTSGLFGFLSARLLDSVRFCFLSSEVWARRPSRIVRSAYLCTGTGQTSLPPRKEYGIPFFFHNSSCDFPLLHCRSRVSSIAAARVMNAQPLRTRIDVDSLRFRVAGTCALWRENLSDGSLSLFRASQGLSPSSGLAFFLEPPGARSFVAEKFHAPTLFWR